MILKRRKYIICFVVVIFLIQSATGLETIKGSVKTAENEYDLVIQNGTVYNPSTEHELEGYNIGISGKEISRITKENIKGIEEIDATGLAVVPGFIDLISYDPNYIGIELKVLDGVTSNLAMHGGTEDATTWYENWESDGVITNFGASSFITRQRWPIIGYDVDAEITTEEEMNQLLEAVEENIRNGALGISFSLEYVPGVKNELKPLLELATRYDIPTFYHLRYADKENGLKGIKEVIDLGKETGAIIHIMHINSTGGTFVMEEALDMVDTAKAEGLDISTCFYPYDFWATYIDSARFRPGWKERFNIEYEDLQIGGTDIRITEETFDKYREEHLLVSAHGSLPEEELRILLKDPDTMIGSDTIIEETYNNHPRGAGTYSRVFGKYVREEKVLSIMEAVKKTSYYPAKRMESIAPAMEYKGRLEVGADADITIFDPETIIDKATVKDTGAPSLGIEYVLVNGEIVKNLDGIVPETRPGEPIKSYFVDERELEEDLLIEVTNQAQGTIKDIKANKINNTLYINIEEICEVIDVALDIRADGSIHVGEDIQAQVGEVEFYKGDIKDTLISEPVLYKEGTYLQLENLPVLLEEAYEVDIKDRKIEVTPIFVKEEVKENVKEESEIEQEEKEPQEKSVNTKEKESSITFKWLIAVSILVVVTFVYIRRKKRK